MPPISTADTEVDTWLCRYFGHRVALKRLMVGESPSTLEAGPGALSALSITLPSAPAPRCGLAFKGSLNLLSLVQGLRHPLRSPTGPCLAL